MVIGTTLSSLLPRKIEARRPTYNNARACMYWVQLTFEAEVRAYSFGGKGTRGAQTPESD